MDLRNRGIDAVPPVVAPFLLVRQKDGTYGSAVSINGAEALPLAGIAHKFTVACNESGQYLVYKHDRHGFHNPDHVWSSRRLSIAAVGDSFTHGICVPSDKNFVAVIRKTYPSTLNLGIDAAGPLLELAAIKEYLPRLRPKLTMWFYYEENDESDLNKEARTALAMKYLKNGYSQGLIGKQSEIDQALTKYIYTTKKFGETSGTREVVDRYLTKTLESFKLSALRAQLGLVYGEESRLESYENNTRLFHQILGTAQAFVDTWQGKLYFVYLPQWGRYVDSELYNDHHDAIIAVVRSLKIPVIDIHRAFQRHGDPLSLFPFRRNGHYNEAGHRLVGQTVLEVISPPDHPNTPGD